MAGPHALLAYARGAFELDYIYPSPARLEGEGRIVIYLGDPTNSMGPCPYPPPLLSHLCERGDYYFIFYISIFFTLQHIL
jgi:hypothetical protein